MNEAATPKSASDTLPSVEKLKMLPGKTLVIGPSRSGKSYFSLAFKQAGLNVVDTDKDTELIKWRNDLGGEPVVPPPVTDEAWLASNHFTIQPEELEQFLAGCGDVIMFAHCWNIMDVIGQFDRVAYMSLPSDELERRLQIRRPDHSRISSSAELEFHRYRHQERSCQAMKRGITFINATVAPIEFYNQLRKVPSRAEDNK